MLKPPSFLPCISGIAPFPRQPSCHHIYIHPVPQSTPLPTWSLARQLLFLLFSAGKTTLKSIPEICAIVLYISAGTCQSESCERIPMRRSSRTRTQTRTLQRQIFLISSTVLWPAIFYFIRGLRCDGHSTILSFGKTHYEIFRNILCLPTLCAPFKYALYSREIWHLSLASMEMHKGTSCFSLLFMHLLSKYLSIVDLLN